MSRNTRVVLIAAVLCVFNILVLGTGTRATKPHQAGHAIRVGLVFDVGGRGDKSFNDSAYNGVKRAEDTLGVEAEYVEPGEGADRESGIRMFAARGFDLVVGVGFIFSDDLYAIAKDYPTVHFACMDYAKFDEHGFVVPPENMVAVKFREEEGSFLVGALAALLSDTETIGFVGGMDIPLIRKFEAGYRAGAGHVCPSCKVLAGYAGTSGDAFKNPQKGKELALAQFASGATTIFHAAGTTGLGVFEAARETGRFAIGVDADQWDEAPGHVLTSMTKQNDVALYEVVRSLTTGSWQGGVHIFGLKENAIDYVYDTHNKAFIPDVVRNQVEALRGEIVQGKVVPPTTVR